MQRLNFDVFMRVIFTFFNQVKFKKYNVIVGLRFMYVHMYLKSITTTTWICIALACVQTYFKWFCVKQMYAYICTLHL